MSSQGISRRSLLTAGAGAFAALALRPRAALAAQGPRLRTLELGALGPAPLRVELPAGVAVAGLRWSGPERGAAEARALLAGGSWGPWVSARGHGHVPDRSAAQGTGEPLWVAGSRALELRSSVPLADARLLLVCDVAGLERAGASPRAGAASPRARAASPRARAASPALAQPLLDAGSGQPAIIARSAWARAVPPPRVAPEYGSVELAFVHHTENPNGYTAAQVPAMLRAIYLFHREFNGWNDIGYNFVVDRFGRVWEARAGGIDEPVTGAHAGGYNYVSSGVAVLGSFSGVAISAAARHSLQRLLAWKLSLHGVAPLGRVTVRVNPAGASYSKYPARAHVSLPRIAGHRDADSTECPGNALYGELPGVRRAVRPMTAAAVRATLELQPAPGGGPPAAGAPPVEAPVPAGPGPPAAGAPAPSEAQPTPQPPSLLVVLTRLDGTPLVGAPVIVQARTVARRGLLVTHTNLAEGVTGADGACVIAASFALGAAAPIWVRALCAGQRGANAAVSPAVEVAPLPGPTAAGGPPAAAPSS